MVGWINWISGIGGISTAECVVPFSRDLSPSGNVYNDLGHGLVVGINATIANQIVRGDVHYGLKKKKVYYIS
jgi:hypothetical protein